MIQNTQLQTASNYHPSPAGYPAVKVRPLDAETRHKIYDRLLDLLSNAQIKTEDGGAALPFILHAKTKDALRSEDGLSNWQVAKLETRITKNAEYLRGFDVTADAPAALYYALQKTDEISLIFENRIAPLPNMILNALVCIELVKEFGRKTLLACDGFIEVRAIDEAGIIHKSIRLDIGGWVIRNGFMVPVYRNGLVSALKIFRNHRDERPFRLQSRSREGYQ
jgi:hypothetical protein